MVEIFKIYLMYFCLVWLWKYGEVELKKYIIFYRNMYIIWGIMMGKCLLYFVKLNFVLFLCGKVEFERVYRSGFSIVYFFYIF